MPAIEEVHLEFNDIRVGTVRGPFESDGTWFGTVELSLDRSAGSEHSRILDYVAFCEDWNERVRSGVRSDASEFDQFTDVVAAGRWRVRHGGGAEVIVADAPVFFRGGEISWVERPQGP